MVFSSPTFLFLFLPITLLLTLISPGIKVKNIVLLITSLVFYSWGEPDLVLLMIVMIALNFFMGKKIDSSIVKKYKVRYLRLGIVVNIVSICYFKYTNFFIDNLNLILQNVNVAPISIKSIRLPIGISFYTFQSISYLIDVFRGNARVQKNPINLGLYISLFPQLIAGPIVRYCDISEQILNRGINFTHFYDGTKRFIVGLGKKVIIANTVGFYANQIFELPPEQVSSFVLMWGALLYGLQIYFDFSGYSDMAIGLGRMFGFKLLENFNYPYIATSIKDFWRRWHISLSSWFRDYLYIPLGGNKLGSRRTYFNLIVVFLATGLWHGAQWNFVLWGAMHGLMLIIERLGFDNVLARIPKVFRHMYVLVFIAFSWILFRVDSLEHFVIYLKELFRFSSSSSYSFRYFFSYELACAVILGLTFSIPFKGIKNMFKSKILFEGVEFSAYLLVLLLSILLLSANTYNPFIYFQF